MNLQNIMNKDVASHFGEEREERKIRLMMAILGSEFLLI